MQVARLVAAACVLAVVGCDKKESLPAAAPIANDTPSARPVESSQVASAAPKTGSAAPDSYSAAEETPKLQLEELRPGISRAQLMATVGDCVERVSFIAATTARRSLEVFQPRDVPCQERLGKQHYLVLGDQLASIEPGLRPKLEPVFTPEDKQQVLPPEQARPPPPGQ